MTVYNEWTFIKKQTTVNADFKSEQLWLICFFTTGSVIVINALLCQLKTGFIPVAVGCMPSY